MSKQWKMNIDVAGDHIVPVRSSMVYVPIGLETTTNEISLYIGDNVHPARQNEIVQAWKWLYHGIRERNLLDTGVPAFKGALLYTGSGINNLNTADRRTESLLATMTADDVIIAMGPDVTALGETLVVEEAFRVLRQFAQETTLKLT